MQKGVSRKFGWKNFVRDKRVQIGYTRDKLAREIGVHPSLITLIESTGHIPSEDRVKRLGEAFGDVDRCLVMAGFIPQRLQPVLLGYLSAQEAG